MYFNKYKRYKTKLCAYYRRGFQKILLQSSQFRVLLQRKTQRHLYFVWSKQN